ncbi:MAG TPA: tetratricopeptide repeat protein, partial [Bryobacteraceae bacterium]|nr:tetratricopeptide repeat protein [Bryobacteraceae bacterium]
ISAVDSLAYVQFGRGRLPEAEALYDRLLALWQKNAAPNHPMVALTLDKMAELYAFQQKYARAQEFAQRALDLRTGAEIASLNQSGRLLIIQGKVGEAADLYRRTVQAGDLMKAPDEVMDPPLRVYATILRQLRREREARVVDRRITDALLHSADRDGRREPPPMPGTSTATPSTPAGHE